MNDSAIKQLSGFMPIVMSGTALIVVIVHLGMFGATKEADEGAAAHIWQLLMAGQVPISIFFATRWLARNQKQALVVLGMQLAAALAACAPVYWFRL